MLKEIFESPTNSYPAALSALVKKFESQGFNVEWVESGHLILYKSGKVDGVVKVDANNNQVGIMSNTMEKFKYVTLAIGLIGAIVRIYLMLRVANRPDRETRIRDSYNRVRQDISQAHSAATANNPFLLFNSFDH